MSSFMSNSQANQVLSKIFGKTDWTPPATMYCALFTAAPTVTGGGTEVTGGSYARVGLTNNTTNFPAAASAQSQNATDIDFTTTLPACTIVGAGWYDLSSGGSLLWYGDFGSAYVESAGAPFKISAHQGSFSIISA